MSRELHGKDMQRFRRRNVFLFESGMTGNGQEFVRNLFS